MCVYVNSVHSHALLTSLKVFMDYYIKFCVWGKYFRWGEVFSSSLSLCGKHLLIHEDLSCTLKRKKVFPCTLWGKYFCVWAAGVCMNTPIPGQDDVAYKSGLRRWHGSWTVYSLQSSTDRPCEDCYVELEGSSGCRQSLCALSWPRLGSAKNPRSYSLGIFQVWGYFHFESCTFHVPACPQNFYIPRCQI